MAFLLPSTALHLYRSHQSISLFVFNPYCEQETSSPTFVHFECGHHCREPSSGRCSFRAMPASEQSLEQACRGTMLRSERAEDTSLGSRRCVVFIL